jgi:predicted histidine transporter YuiF (NhaC family)
MRYIINQQVKRFLVIAAMVGYTYFQLHRIHDMKQLDWYIVVAVNVVGALAIIVITAKIRIASEHLKHHRQEGNKHHGTANN